MKFRSCFASLPLLLVLSSGPAQAEGQAQYPLDEETMTVDVCMTCHGTNGQGNPVVGAPAIAQLEPWYLERQLRLFRDGLRGTQRDYIPGFEMRESVKYLSDEQISNIALYIASWDPAAPSATIDGDAQHGRQLYTNCAICHGMQGEGNRDLGSPRLAGQNDWYLLRQLKLFKSGYRGTHPDDTGGRQMRNMMQNLDSEQDMIDVISYMNTF